MNRTRRSFALLLSLFLLTAVFSAAFPVSVSAASVPDAPELSITQLAGRFTLSWSQPANGGSAITSYSYAYCPESERIESQTPQSVDNTHTSVTTPFLDDYGVRYQFILWANNAVGAGEKVTAAATLLHQNNIDVQNARNRIEATSFSASIEEASSEEALKAYLKAQIEDFGYGASVTINLSSYDPAQLTQVGSFIFTASLSIGNSWESSYASTVTDQVRGVISSSGKLSTPKIVIATSESGGLSYTISTTGSAAQAELIQNFKVTIYDVLNESAVVSDYTVNAAEKSGTIGLSAGLKGETSYRAAVKACSSDTRKYLDSDLSDLSVSAKAGRIPVTIRPSVTEKLYGDTEPVFGYTIVKGPDPLPSGVDLKLTFTRGEGTDVGTYDFSYLQTDTNYEVTVEATVFTIKPRPLTITPADREVVYQQGTTYLLTEVGEADGLVEGDKITSLEFDSSAARGEVGEYEITATKAVIMSGAKDVTKNYEITFAVGRLTIHPVGYTAGTGGGFPLWAILAIAAGVLLLAAGTVLFFVLRKRKKDAAAEAEEGEEGGDLPTDENGMPLTDGETAPDSDEADPNASGSDRDPYQEYLEIIDMESVEAKAQAELDAEQAAEAQKVVEPLLTPEEEAQFSEAGYADDLIPDDQKPAEQAAPDEPAEQDDPESTK